ncbi:hypothetical protein B484DRAFT_440517, partial [Ochromonadaceae sp. CCMP2298]
TLAVRIKMSLDRWCKPPSTADSNPSSGKHSLTHSSTQPSLAGGADRLGDLPPLASRGKTEEPHAFRGIAGGKQEQVGAGAEQGWEEECGEEVEEGGEALVEEDMQCAANRSPPTSRHGRSLSAMTGTTAASSYSGNSAGPDASSPHTSASTSPVDSPRKLRSVRSKRMAGERERERQREREKERAPAMHVAADRAWAYHAVLAVVNKMRADNAVPIVVFG